MKAIVVQRFYDTLDELQITNIAPPQPNPEEYVIKVIAAGVNHVDLLYVRGKHQNNTSRVRPPFILGLEFAGIIVQAPPGAQYERGNAVFGECPGTYAEYLTVPTNASSLRPIPRGWSFTDAAGLAGTLPVSYGALVLSGRLIPGETVLIHSAAGGLGIMAVQVAIAKGCRVYATAASEKCAYVREHGATCFDSGGNWWDLVRAETKGVDLVFDPVGLVDLSMKCIAPGGRILVIGFAARDGQMEKIAMNRLLLKRVTLIGYLFGETLRGRTQDNKIIWSELDQLLDAGKIRPTASEYEGLESVPRALKDLEDRKVLSKAVIRVSHDMNLEQIQ